VRLPIPTNLKGFEQHGVHLQQPAGDDQWIGSCPFCGKEGHFYVSSDTKLWDCKRCQRSGNFEQFLARVSGRNEALLDGTPLAELVEDRGVRPSTLRKWRVGWDGTRYTLPVLNVNGRVINLRRFSFKGGAGNTATCKLTLIGLERLAEDEDEVWLCEGEWDAVAWSECLARNKIEGVCIAVPGAGSFRPEWASLFRDRQVCVAMDHDDAGRAADNRVYEALRGIASKLSFLQWPEKLPDGYDLRDLYRDKRASAYELASAALSPEPRYHAIAEDRRAAEEPHAKTPTGRGLPCKEVYKAYRRWLHLPDTDVLDVLYGTMLANRISGDPLWLFLIGAPGAAKTELLMCFDGAPLVVTTTSLTPHALVSGATGMGGADPSLIPRLNGKVLVIKDFTTIMSTNPTARDEVFGVLRDAFDGKTEKVFGSGIVRSHTSLFGLIAGVTPRIDMLDYLHASLGERFIKYRIGMGAEAGMSQQALIETVIENIAQENHIRSDLQKVAAAALDFKVEQLPDIPPTAIRELSAISEIVAAMRGVVVRERYSGEVLYEPTPEIGTRLAKQFTKLALGIALFRRLPALNADVLRIVKQVAKDTVPGRVHGIAKGLLVHHEESKKGVSAKTIGTWVGLPQDTIWRVLNDLRLLKVVVCTTMAGSSKLWRLAPRFRRLMEPLNLYEKEESWRNQRKRGHRRVVRRRSER